MQGFADMLTAERRLAILQLLVMGGGEAGENAIEKGLHMQGHRAGVTHTQVRQDLQDLAARDCLRIDYFQDQYMVAKITRRGVDVAEGVIQVEGVARPPMGV